MPAQWEQIAAQKQGERLSKIPNEWRLPTLMNPPSDVTAIPRACGLLSEKELDITENHTAQGIVAAVVGKGYTAEEVTLAFCKRAAIAQQVTNCLTEIFFDQALERARYLDQYLMEKGKPVGPLHGLPVSLKDCFSVSGFASSVGLSYRAFDKDTEHSALSTILLSAGAILYVKTTTPQAQLSLDTDSNVWGRTLNPHKATLAAGGSSGGEGALIAMKGSILGIGTDMGGSIRVPAANCAIYGFKPTSRRVPRQGTDTWEPLGCQYTGIPTVAGPLTRSVSDIKWFFKFLEAAQPWRLDPQVFPFTMGFPAEKVRRLTIGILQSNGVTNPLPPVRSMLGEIQSALRAAGHKVEVIHVKSYPTAFKIANALMTIAGSERIFDVLESVGNEPLSPWLAARMSRRPGKSLPEFYQLQHQKQEAESALLHEIWERGTGRERLDVILCPTAGHPTPKHDDWGPVDWTSPWNLVDYPVGVLPVRRVLGSELKTELAVPSLGRYDDGIRKLWSPEVRNAFADAPMAIQVVARKGYDGMLCEALESIDEVLKRGRGSSKL